MSTDTNRRRRASVTQAFEPPRAILALFDWVARALGALALIAALATRVLPFARTHGRNTDLLLCVALVLIAVSFLKAFGPTLSTELRGVAYTALLVAGGLAFYLVTVSPGRTTVGGHRDGHQSAIADSRASRSSHAEGSSDAKTGTGSRHARRVAAASSSSGRSEPRSVSSHSTTTTPTGSSTTADTTDSQDSSAPRRSYAPQRARQTATTVPNTPPTHVEVENSKAPSAPPAKASPAVEVESDKAQGSGIEVGSN
jgi:hypothetical protein